MTKILDSSVIVALFREEELLHRRALEIFMQQDEFLVLDYVLAEVLTVLKSREGLEVAKICAEFLKNTRGIEIFYVTSDIFNLTFQVFLQQKNKLSFMDTLLLVFNKFEKLQLVTFDKALAKAKI